MSSGPVYPPTPAAERQSTLAFIRKRSAIYLNNSCERLALDALARDIEAGAHVKPEFSEADYRAEFHRLWGVAQEVRGYRKDEWRPLDRDLNSARSPSGWRAAVIDARSLARDQGVREVDLYPAGHAEGKAP